METGTAEGPAAAATPKKPELTWLRIERFRNVEPCSLRFGDGFNVLLGLNATGKTTLLELIAAALSFDFSKFKDEAFAIEYELAFSTGTIVVSMRSERANRAALEAPLLRVRNAERFGLSAKLQFGSAHALKMLTVSASMSFIWIEDGPQVKAPLNAPLRERKAYLLFEAAKIAASESLSDAWWCANTRRFDEALGMFRDIASPSTSIEPFIDPPKNTVTGFSVDGFLPLELIDAVGQYVVGMPIGSQGLTIPAECRDWHPHTRPDTSFRIVEFCAVAAKEPHPRATRSPRFVRSRCTCSGSSIRASGRSRVDQPKPKDEVCLGSKHNHELAGQGFPARAVHDIGKSFHETVERLRSSPALVAALAATHPGY